MFACKKNNNKKGARQQQQQHREQRKLKSMKNDSRFTFFNSFFFGILCYNFFFFSLTRIKFKMSCEHGRCCLHKNSLWLQVASHKETRLMQFCVFVCSLFPFIIRICTKWFFFLLLLIGEPVVNERKKDGNVIFELVGCPSLSLSLTHMTNALFRQLLHLSLKLIHKLLWKTTCMANLCRDYHRLATHIHTHIKQNAFLPWKYYTLPWNCFHLSLSLSLSLYRDNPPFIQSVHNIFSC